jgi:signal transduction histidine kinase
VVLVPLLALLIAVAAFAALTAATANEEQLVVHTQTVRSDLRQTLILLLDAETGVRGYLLTGDPDYLQPYDEATSALPSTLHQLTTEVADNPVQSQKVSALLPRAEQELRDLSQLRAESPGNPNVALLAQSKAGMDDLRQRLNDMDSEEVQLLDARAAQVQTLRTLTTVAIGFSLLIGILGALFAALRFGRLLATEERARADAEAALQVRDDFLSVAAHELKTPVAALQLTAEVELRRIERGEVLDPTRITQRLQTIVHESRRLGRLVDHLLDVTRLQRGQLAIDLEEVDLTKLVRNVVDAARQLNQRRQIRMTAPAELLTAVDPVLISQVLMNLIDNALRFSPSDQPIEIDLSQPTAGTVGMVVTDHGVGIAPALRPHLFEPYFQAHRGTAQRGLGLSLYLSQQIVLRHGGRILVEFPEAGGARFIVELPVQ